MARRLKAEAHYECALCHKVTDRLAVHHIRPIETGRTVQEMERLCFDDSNAQVLCYDCHAMIHREQHNTQREAHLKAEAQRIERYETGQLEINNQLLL